MHVYKFFLLIKVFYFSNLRQWISNSFTLLQNPKWYPPRLEDVDMADIESVFDPLPTEMELDVWQSQTEGELFIAECYVSKNKSRIFCILRVEVYNSILWKYEEVKPTLGK